MRRESGTSGPLIFIAIGLLVLLPVLYILSAGPASWLYTHGYLSPDEGGFVWVFYTPMRWVCERCEPASDFITWYQSFFVPDTYPR